MQLLIFVSTIVVLALISGYTLLYTIRNRHRKWAPWLVVLAIALAPPASLIWVPFVMRLFFSTS